MPASKLSPFCLHAVAEDERYRLPRPCVSAGLSPLATPTASIATTPRTAPTRLLRTTSFADAVRGADTPRAETPVTTAAVPVDWQALEEGTLGAAAATLPLAEFPALPPLQSVDTGVPAA